MRIRELPPELAEEPQGHELPGLVEIRVIPWGRVLSGTWEDRLAIVIQEWWEKTAHNTLYEYDNTLEQEHDVRRVMEFGFGGRGGSAATGVPVAPRPSPQRPAADAKPWQEES